MFELCWKERSEGRGRRKEGRLPCEHHNPAGERHRVVAVDASAEQAPLLLGSQLRLALVRALAGRVEIHAARQNTEDPGHCQEGAKGREIEFSRQRLASKAEVASSTPLGTQQLVFALIEKMKIQLRSECEEGQERKPELTDD